MKRIFAETQRGASPRIALTYDDGPGPDSAALASRLAELDVPATFFLLGEACESRPDAVRSMGALGGITLGSHSHSHPDLQRLDPPAIREELRRSIRTIEHLSGQTVTQFRPPYGRRSEAVAAAAGAVGLPVVLWSLNSFDWRDSAGAAAHVIRQARDGDIVLLHDTDPQVLLTSESIVEGLRAKGYEFVPVEHLLGPTQPGGVYEGSASPWTMRARWLQRFAWTVRHRGLRVAQRKLDQVWRNLQTKGARLVRRGLRINATSHPQGDAIDNTEQR